MQLGTSRDWRVSIYESFLTWRLLDNWKAVIFTRSLPLLLPLLLVSLQVLVLLPWIKNIERPVTLAGKIWLLLNNGDDVVAIFVGLFVVGFVILGLITFVPIVVGLVIPVVVDAGNEVIWRLFWGRRRWCADFGENLVTTRTGLNRSCDFITGLFLASKNFN